MAVLLSGMGWTVARQAPPPVLATVRPPPPLLLKESLQNFRITKRPPLLVTPNRSTPTQPLYLTNVDDSLSLRAHANILLFYLSRDDSFRNNSGKGADHDPVEVIGEALAKLLVDYYPFAGRLRSANKGKLIMDCTGEGALLVEADADISLEDLGDLSPPIPRAHDFINNVQPSDPIKGCPLLLCQVTRLRCGGFILGLHFNHCLTDGVGITQFVIALSEIARGAAKPTVSPVWNREILRPRAKPTVNSHALRLHNDFVHKSRGSYVSVPSEEEETRSTSFYFGPKEIEALKRQVKGVKHCTTFEVIAASLWQSRTKALNFPTHEDSILMFPFNARSRFRPRLPTGYYGNVIAGVYAKTRARDLTTQPLSFAVKLINESKKRVDEEYIRSMVDLAELNGCPLRPLRGSYVISDVSDIARAAGEADFGWGKAVYVCPAFTLLPGVSYLMRASKDCEGIRVPVCLPSNAMEIFEENINKSINAGMQA